MTNKPLIHILLVTVVSATFGCSTPQKTRTLAMGVGFAAGSVIGAATAPADERKDLHALYWGGIIGLGAGLVSNYLYDESDKVEKLELETQNLKQELKIMDTAKKIQVKDGRGQFKNSVPGHWHLYQVDRWEKESSLRLHHVDQEIEIDPEKPSE